MWLRYLAFGAIVCLCSCTVEHANLAVNQEENIDILEELRLLRKMVEENRILITKQETELKAVKRELEDSKRNSHCGSTSDGKKTTSNRSDSVVSQKEATLIRRGRIIPSNSPDGPVAFYGYMSTTMAKIGGHDTLIFDVIKTNSGNGLYPTTGVFTAPSSGLRFYLDYKRTRQ